MKKRLFACVLALCVMLATVCALCISVAADSASVATVTANGKTYDALTFADAVNTAIVNENSTITLTADSTIDALEIGGDYTLDLNGKTLTVTAPLTLSFGVVTVTDSSADGNGRIAATASSAISLLSRGSLKLLAGTVHSEKSYAIDNRGTGILYLSGKPTVSSGSASDLYLGYPRTLHGADGNTAYSGAAIDVFCGFAVADGSVLVENGSAALFNTSYANPDDFLVQEQGGNLVIAEIANYVWYIIAGLIVVAAGLLIYILVRTIWYKSKMKFYSRLNSFALPALLSVLAIVTQAQQIALGVAGAVCVIALILSILSTRAQGKKLKAKREAYEAANAATQLGNADATAAAAAADTAEPAADAAEPATDAAEPAADAAEPATDAAEPAADAAEPAADTTEPAADAEEPVAEEPVVEEPVVEEPVAEEPVVEEPVVEEPVVEEPVVEEPVAEEPVVEEPVVEEPVVEEPVAEEPVVEEPVADEAAPVVAEPPKARPDRVVVAETDANGNVIYSAYKKSFTARVIQSPDDVQERYETLKNALLSYKKVNSRVSWSYDSIKCGRKQLAKFAIRGKSLCLFLALDMASLEGSKYNVTDVSDSKKYATVPCRLRLSSKRSIKWGLELIAKLAEQEGLVPNPKFKPKSWRMDNETTESLLEKGLIKKIL